MIPAAAGAALVFGACPAPFAPCPATLYIQNSVLVSRLTCISRLWLESALRHGLGSRSSKGRALVSPISGCLRQVCLLKNEIILVVLQLLFGIQISRFLLHQDFKFLIISQFLKLPNQQFTQQY